jgi:Flp pilus assembly pilin Flp
MNHLMCNAWHQDSGQDIAEYALMLTVILLVTLAVVQSIGSGANGIFAQIANAL